ATGRGVGTSGTCGGTGKSRTTGVRDCGSEGEKRRAVSVRRRGSDVEKSNGGQADRRVLVHERDFRGPEERRRCLCASAKPVPFDGRRAHVYGDKRRAGWR